MVVRLLACIYTAITLSDFLRYLARYNPAEIRAILVLRGVFDETTYIAHTTTVMADASKRHSFNGTTGSLLTR